MATKKNTTITAEKGSGNVFSPPAPCGSGGEPKIGRLSVG
jgi:hypothetical protein